MSEIIIINNKGQYNHRIQRSLSYLDIPSELVDKIIKRDARVLKELSKL